MNTTKESPNYGQETLENDIATEEREEFFVNSNNNENIPFENFLTNDVKQELKNGESVNVAEAIDRRTQKIADLVSDVKNGNFESATELVKMTEGYLKHVAYSRLQNKADVDDVVQECYNHNFEVISQLQDNSKFVWWMATSVKNRSYNYNVKQNRRNTVELSSLDKTDEDGKVESAQDNIQNTTKRFNPTDNFQNKDLKIRVKEILEELPENQKMCLEYRYIFDFSTKQTAELMEMSEGTVKSNVHYAMNFLKKRLSSMRAKGTAFFGIGAIPFFIWAIEEEIKDSGFTPVVVHASTIQPVPSKSTSAKAKSNNLSQTTNIARKASLTKIISGVAIAGVVGVGAIAGGRYMFGNSMPNTKIAESTNKKSVQKEDLKEKYEPILIEYAKKIKDSINNQVEEPMNGAETASSIYMTHDDDSENRLDNYGYAYIDLNNDGISELLIGSTKSTNPASAEDGILYPKGSFYYLYAINEKNNPEKIDILKTAFEEKVETQSFSPYNFYLTKDNRIYCKNNSIKELQFTKDNTLKIISEQDINTFTSSGLNDDVVDNLQSIKYTPFSTILKPDKNEEKNQDAGTSVNSEETASTSYGVYSDILDAYYLAAKNFNPNESFDSSSPAQSLIIDAYYNYPQDALNYYGFCLKDINGDGVEELLFGKTNDPNTILDIYMNINGSVLKCAYKNSDSFEFFGDGNVDSTSLYKTSLLSNGQILQYVSGNYDDEFLSTINSDGAYIQSSVHKSDSYYCQNNSETSKEACDQSVYDNFVNTYHAMIQSISYTPLSSLK